MTVEELIFILGGVPGDTKIYVSDANGELLLPDSISFEHAFPAKVGTSCADMMVTYLALDKFEPITLMTTKGKSLILKFNRSVKFYAAQASK